MSDDLAAAEQAQRRLAGGLRLPAGFHAALGGAVAVQVGTAAYSLTDQSGPRPLVLLAGFAVFLAVAALLVGRFRRLNGVRVAGLVSRAVFGTSARSSVVYAAGLVAALWAAAEDRAVLAGLAALATGVAYAASAAWWWRDYQRDPAAHVRGESPRELVLYGVLAAAGLVVLLVAA